MRAGDRAGGQVNEFKAMVRAMHEAGLEVILDVVFNHTAEGGEGGPSLCFRGLDNTAYYRLNRSAGPEITSWSGRGRSWCCAARRGYGRGASSPGSSAVGEPGEWTGCRSETKGADTRMEIRRKRADTRPGPRDWFTGQVWVADEDDQTTYWGEHVTDDEYQG